MVCLFPKAKFRNRVPSTRKAAEPLPGPLRRNHGFDGPVESKPLIVAFGATPRKPAAVGDRVNPPEFLGRTFVLEHDVIDGAPMPPCLQRLRELMKDGFGLQAPPSPDPGHAALFKFVPTLDGRTLDQPSLPRNASSRS